MTLNGPPFKNGLFVELEFDQHNVQKYNSNISSKSKVKLKYFFDVEKIYIYIYIYIYVCVCVCIKIKRAVVSLSKICRLNIFVTQQNLIRTLEIHYKKGQFFHKIFNSSQLKFGKMKNPKIKKQPFRRPVNRKTNFFTN